MWWSTVPSWDKGENSWQDEWSFLDNYIKVNILYIQHTHTQKKHIREFITFSSLNDIVKNQDVSIVGGLENENVLVLRLFMMKDLFNLERHGYEKELKKRLLVQCIRYLPWPGHMVDFSMNQPSTMQGCEIGADMFKCRKNSKKKNFFVDRYI